MTNWQTNSSEVIYENQWIRLCQDEVVTQTGKQLTYTYMELQNPSVFVVAVNAEKQILLQSVYRHPVRQRLWEIPAGFIDEGEEPQTAAKRELLEEAGLVSENWQHLGLARQITGSGNVPLHVFLATDVRSVGQATDEEEDIIDHQFKSLEEIESMIVHGTLVDSPVIAALYMAKVHGL